MCPGIFGEDEYGQGGGVNDYRSCSRAWWEVKCIFWQTVARAPLALGHKKAFGKVH